MQVLIIDEISMISGELFHQLEAHMRKLRANDEPFGGVQLILSGDFFQCALLHLQLILHTLCLSLLSACQSYWSAVSDSQTMQQSCAVPVDVLELPVSSY